MEAIQNDPDRIVIGSPNDLPGVSIVVDVTSPRQGFESNTQTPCARSLSQFAKVIGSAFNSTERDGRDIAANEQQIGAQLLHKVEFLFGPAKAFCALGFGHSFKIAKWLESADAEAEIAAHPGNVARSAVEAGKVVLEDFYGIEAGRSDGPELLIEGSANGNRCNRTYHIDAPACCDGLTSLRVLTGLVVADPQIAEHSFDCHFPLQPEFPRNGKVSPENDFPGVSV
jgi:hypothetical protein